MRTNPLKVCRIAFGATFLIVVACRSGGPANDTTELVDRRIAVALPVEGQQAVLEEMRQMLGAMGGAMAAAARDDSTALLAAIAPARSAAAADPKLEALLPAGWKVLAERTHMGFDELATSSVLAARRYLLKDTALVRLAQLTTACTACHQTYRITIRSARR